PLFCAKLIQSPHTAKKHATDRSEEPAASPARERSWGERFNVRFARNLTQLLDFYEDRVHWALKRPRAVVVGISGAFLFSLVLYPLLGVAFFPRTDAGQFVVNLKAPSGTRVEDTDRYVDQVEGLIRKIVAPQDLKLILSNIGVIPGFSSIYTSN